MLFVLLIIPLVAEDFSHSIIIDNLHPYEKEALLLNVEINQTNPNTVLFFKFDINSSDAYSIEQIESIYDNTLHHNTIHNRYLIYPLKTGKVPIHFTLIKRVTDEEKVAYYASGDRDDFKKLETKDIAIPLTPLVLQVKALPPHTQLVGDYRLHTTLKKTHVKSQEPIDMQVNIEGEGYPPVLKELFSPLKEVTLFKQKPQIEKFPTRTNMHYKVHYLMALSSAHSFTLPDINITAFNPKTEHLYTLTHPAQQIEVVPANHSTLVDSMNNPPLLKSDWSWIQEGFTYLLIFLAGYLTALVWRGEKKFRTKLKNPLKEKIEATKDAKTLLQLLMAQDDPRFHKPIAALENALYQNGKIQLNKVKKEAVDTL